MHDALLIEAPVNEIEAAAETTQTVMRNASEIVLDGLPLRTEAKIVRHPDRDSDKRGKAMWEVVCEMRERTP